MPLARAPYRFPGLEADAFYGLPGLLRQHTPDRSGDAVIDAWLASQGRAPSTYDVVERLCYMGSAGIGALLPALGICCVIYLFKILRLVIITQNLQPALHTEPLFRSPSRSRAIHKGYAKCCDTCAMF